MLAENGAMWRRDFEQQAAPQVNKNDEAAYVLMAIYTTAFYSIGSTSR